MILPRTTNLPELMWLTYCFFSRSYLAFDVDVDIDDENAVESLTWYCHSELSSEMKKMIIKLSDFLSLLSTTLTFVLGCRCIGSSSSN